MGMNSLHDTARPVAQTGTTRGSSQATRLVDLSKDVELFHTPEGTPYGTFAVDGHHETWPVRSTHFEHLLVNRFYESEKCAPKDQELHDALGTISAEARLKGRELPVFTRLAEWWDNIYLDLGDPEWQVVEVKPSGWRITDRSPVRFRRSNGTLPLPKPELGGSISSLRPFVNVTDNDWILFASWLVAASGPRVLIRSSAFTANKAVAKPPQAGWPGNASTRSKPP